jgi:hypothetical protein
MKALVVISSLLVSAMLATPLFADLIVPVKKQPFQVQFMGESAKQIFTTFVEKNKNTKQTAREDGGTNYEVKTKDFSFLCVAFKFDEKLEVGVCYAEGKGNQNFEEGSAKK